MPMLCSTLINYLHYHEISWDSSIIRLIGVISCIYSLLFILILCATRRFCRVKRSMGREVCGVGRRANRWEGCESGGSGGCEIGRCVNSHQSLAGVLNMKYMVNLLSNFTAVLWGGHHRHPDVTDLVMATWNDVVAVSADIACNKSASARDIYSFIWPALHMACFSIRPDYRPIQPFPQSTLFTAQLFPLYIRI